MNCIAPEEIQAGDLLAYLEGEASRIVVEHLADCLFCAHEVDALQQAETLLRLALFRRDCPDSDSLLMYQADLLDAAGMTELEAHLNACRHCRQALDQLDGAGGN